MIVLDANILLYAYDSSAAKHPQARAWVELVFSNGTLVGIPWQTVSAFLRVITNTNLPGQRFTAEEAAQVIDQWLEQPNVRIFRPGDEHWNFLRRALIDGQARGPLVADAHLVALTLEHGGVLCTTDRDFARFPGLHWSNPLDA